MSINGIEITDVIVFPVRKSQEGNKRLAYVKIILNDSLIFNGITIYEGHQGPFIRFPQQINEKNSKGYDIVFPIKAELRNYISEQVIAHYEISVNLNKESIS